MKSILHVERKMRILAALIAVAAIAYGQTPASQPAPAVTAGAATNTTSTVPQWQIAAGGKKEFEVASVRESTRDTPPKGMEMLMPHDGPSPKGGLFSANAPLILYVVFAYKITDSSKVFSLMSEMPKWTQESRFDIEARAEENSSKDQIRLMMQSLLKDRFKLAFHIENKQSPVYALVLDKPGKLGPLFQPHSDSKPCVPKPEGPAKEDTSNTARPLYCGFDAWPANGLTHMRMLDATMEQATLFLGGTGATSGGLDRLPTLDRTGLSGRFDINIEFAPEFRGPGADSDAVGPTFSGALLKQLGMKLVKQTGNAPVIVIEHIEKPSAN